MQFNALSFTKYQLKIKLYHSGLYFDYSSSEKTRNASITASSDAIMAAKKM